MRRWPPGTVLALIGLGGQRVSAGIPICVLAKTPRPGRVKTRLISAVGRRGASDLARAFATDALAAAAKLPWARPILVATGLPWPAPVLPHAAETWPQGRGDLGARLERAFARALATSPAAIAIGADSPGLPPALLEAARAGLARADAVLGPCEDGGFYALGLRRCPSGLLAGLPWSRADTLEAVYARLSERGFQVELMPAWFDIDRPADLDRFRTAVARGEVDAPASARLLAPPTISAIIPALDEESRIGPAVQRLRALSAQLEIIVVDGGSRDRTRVIASELGATVLTSARGRAHQLNFGARRARGDVLLFCHADVSLPVDAVHRIADAMVDRETVAGAFLTHTVADGGWVPWFAPLLRIADLRSRVTRLPYGDQAMFVRREVFERVGGFPHQALLEDLELSRRLRRVGRVHRVPANVRVSGRRFASRPVTAALAVNTIPALYRLGVPAALLARWYGHIR